jgi:hypothetical protein
MAKCLGKKAPTIKAGAMLTGMVWRTYAIKKIFTRKAPLITKATARTAIAVAEYTNGKILQALPGFAFTDMDTTIRKMANSYKC